MTGSGKTHTMLGDIYEPEGEAGIVSLAVILHNPSDGRHILSSEGLVNPLLLQAQLHGNL